MEKYINGKRFDNNFAKKTPNPPQKDVGSIACFEILHISCFTCCKSRVAPVNNKVMSLNRCVCFEE